MEELSSGGDGRPAGSVEGDLLDELRERCNSAGITFQTREDARADETYYAIELPAGRETRRILIVDSGDARRVLAVPFEQHVFLGDYEAVCSYSDGTIEAALGSVGPMPVSLHRLRELLTEESEEEDESGVPTGWSVSRDDGLSVSLGSPTSTFEAIVRGPASRTLTLQIAGVQVSQHDQALDMLETLANSLFFQLEEGLDFSVALRRRRRPLRRGRRRRDGPTLDGVVFPRYQYDAQPISLYWYAAGALGMPLLQFLAYYQTIEFYFPVYSELEVRRRLRYVLKDPAFDAHSDIALGRLLSIIDARRGGAFGSERDQLRATVDECVTEQDVIEFITETQERADFFRGKHPNLTSVQIRVGEGATGIRDAVADRIYDVRCRIVHAKESEVYAEAILPFSAEADLLARHDIELVRHIARRVLVAASRPLSV